MNIKEITGKINEDVLKKEKVKLIIYFVFILLVSFFIVYGYIIMTSFFLIFLFFIIPAYIFLFKKYLKFKLMKKLIKLRKNWGQEIKRERDFNLIKFLFEVEEKKDKMIDEQTWNDLNLENIYAQMDRTFTNAGESVLYLMLRTPSYDRQKLMFRNQIIKLFCTDQYFRENIQLELQKIDRQLSNSVTKILWQELPTPATFSILFSLLGLLSLLSFVSIIFIGFGALIFISVMMVINSLVINKYKKKYLHRVPLSGVHILVKMIKAGKNISNMECTLLKSEFDNLRKWANSGNKLIKKIRYILPKTSSSELDIISEYLNMMFLLEVRSFNSIFREIKKNQGKLQKLYIKLGELDVFQSIACYRESLQDYCVPEFSCDRTTLIVKDIYHPLLKKPVKNSLEIKQKGIIITGSNMAGKSTFFRTIGVNTLLAETIVTCMASLYKSSFFQIITSISRTDNIIKGKSFYFAEAERLLQLINTAEGKEITVLCIIDELLSGTNSLERIIASEEILDYLTIKNALTIVATHDLELVQKLRSQYECYHFTDNVSQEKGLDFDYKIKKGLAVTSNAIKLLEHLGYPERIINKAIFKAVQELKRQNK